MNKKGKVYLVGAGPGDPKLITVKGQELLAKAEVIVYDRLASPRLLEVAPEGAEKIYCGKLPDRHTIPQDEINRILVDKALEGKRVVRLKGGDPSIFGRVGEEAEYCADHGIEFEVVPGITSGIAAPMYAGIPLTHRDMNSSLAFVTGHKRVDDKGTEIRWDKLATGVETLVFYMGVGNLGYIRDQLLEHGRSPETPTALIRWGTLGRQETLVGTLDNIERKVREAAFAAPAIIVVGEVVRLREKLAWFERKPRFGQTVWIVPGNTEGDQLQQQVEEEGGEAIIFPRVEVHVQSDKLDRLDLSGGLMDYDGLLFTRLEMVHLFFKQLRLRRVDIRSLTVKMAGVNPAVMEALSDKGIVPSSIEDINSGERWLFMGTGLDRHWVCSLAEQGATVIDTEWFAARVSAEERQYLMDLLAEQAVDELILTDPASVDLLIKAGFTELPAHIKITCLHDKTLQKARDAGLLQRDSTM